jgi:hypothetical protein
MKVGDRIRTSDFTFILQMEFPSIKKSTLELAAKAYIYTATSLVTRRGSLGGVYKGSVPPNSKKTSKRKRNQPLALVKKLTKKRTKV